MHTQTRTLHNAFGIGDNQGSRYQCVTLFAVLFSRSAGGFFVEEQFSLNGMNWCFMAAGKREDVAAKRKQGQGGGNEEAGEGGLKGRMFHSAFQAYTTVDAGGV